jgi:hypothetical protein
MALDGGERSNLACTTRIATTSRSLAGIGMGAASKASSRVRRGLREHAAPIPIPAPLLYPWCSASSFAARAEPAPFGPRRMKSPARVIGRGLWDAGLFADRLAAAGPDQRVPFAVFVIEQAGEDRRVEARIIQLDREIIAALAGAL